MHTASFAGVQDAARQIAGHAVRTPLIESPALAAEVSAGIEEDMAEIAYRLRLRKGGQKGALDWIETDATGALIIHRTEPGTTLFSRTVLRLAGRLPIEWLL